MKKLFVLSLSYVLCSVFLFNQLSASEKKPEPNPFAQYFKRIKRLEDKKSNLEGTGKKNSRQIKVQREAYEKKITKEQAKLDKKVKSMKKPIEIKIASLEKRIKRGKSAGIDVLAFQKQLDKQKYLLAKIDAWAKNEKPPEEEAFNPDKQESSSDDSGDDSSK